MKSQKLRLSTLPVAACVLALAFSPGAVAAGEGPSLAGETLQGNGVLYDGNVFPSADYIDVTSNPAGCNPSGTSRIEFDATGPAVGPFPGTYTEHVVITLGPQTTGLHPNSSIAPGVLAGPVTSFSSTFTITSVAGTVTGTKALIPDAENWGSCYGTTAASGADFAYDYLTDFYYAERAVNTRVSYSATITPTAGNAYKDSGSGMARFDEGGFGGTCSGDTEFCRAVQQNSSGGILRNTFFTQTGFEEFFFNSTGTQPVNSPPIADSKVVTVEQDGYANIQLTGTDPDGDQLTYSVASQPTHGTLSGSGSNLTYTPDPGYVGADSFTYRADDGQSTSSPATVSITVTPQNLPSTTAQCKNGGYKNYPVFKNQGDCVSFVATRGKNPPAHG